MKKAYRPLSSSSNKRFCKWNAAWKTEFDWVEKSTDVHRVHCRFCKHEILVAHGGRHDLRRHGLAERHIAASQRGAHTPLLPKGFKLDPLTATEAKVAAAEAGEAFHAVQHNMSYSSLDCGMQLSSLMYEESEKLTCGRLKAEAIVENILGPYSLECLLRDLHTPGLSFALSLDTSNRGDVNFFPLVVRYFRKDEGVVHAVLGFYEGSDESAERIAERITVLLKRHSLPWSKVSALAINSASEAYDEDALHTQLQETCPSLFKTNCLARIIHSAARTAAAKLTYDVEAFVMKMYCYLSGSAVRTHELKDFLDFCAVDYESLLRQVPTSWLSLLPAIQKIIQHLPALQSYILSQGEEDTPRLIWEYFVDNRSGTSALPTLQQCYLLFLHTILAIFNEQIAKFERSNLTVAETFTIMCSLKHKLESHLSDRFFGSTLCTIMEDMEKEDCKKLEKDFVLFLQTAVRYLEKQFDFSEDGALSKLSCLALNRPLDFDELLGIVNSISLQDSVDEHKLFEDYSIVSPVVLEIVELDLSPVEKWQAVFRDGPDLPSLYALVARIISIPPTNAYVKGIFSLLKTKWVYSSNQLRRELVKAELMASVNYRMQCSEFYAKVLANQTLLQAVKFGVKYTFKNKTN